MHLQELQVAEAQAHLLRLAERALASALSQGDYTYELEREREEEAEYLKEVSEDRWRAEMYFD